MPLWFSYIFFFFLLFFFSFFLINSSFCYSYILVSFFLFSLFSIFFPFFSPRFPFFSSFPFFSPPLFFLYFFFLSLFSPFCFFFSLFFAFPYFLPSFPFPLPHASPVTAPTSRPGAADAKRPCRSWDRTVPGCVLPPGGCGCCERAPALTKLPGIKAATRELMRCPRAAYQLWLAVTVVKWLLVPAPGTHG